MTERNDDEAEALQNLSEMAIAHDIIIRTLLNLQELSNPGFSAELLKQLDSSLGRKPSNLPEQGWVRVRARLQTCLQDAMDAAKAARE